MQAGYIIVMETKDRAEYIVQLVRNNLLYYQLWTNVCVNAEQLNWRGQIFQVITGRPSHKLSNDAAAGGDTKLECVLPVEMCDYKNSDFTLECLDQVFTKLCNKDCKRLTLAIVNNDGTVMFYFVYKGIHKPKRN